MNSSAAIGKATYLGLFMITMATLMYELLLTRIFSVTMWYHFAFMAISVAMFGLTVGAIIVYLFPAFFTQEGTTRRLAASSLAFSVLAIASFLVHLKIRFTPDTSFAGFSSIALTYTVISVPFIFSGIAVSLALTRFPAQVNKLYAADLAGAAFGCVAFIYTLEITDGPTAVTVTALFAAVGGILFGAAAGSRWLRRVALVLTLLFGVAAVVQTYFVNRQSPLVRLGYAKRQIEYPPLYEKWNSFSRIRIDGNPAVATPPSGWGLSPVYPRDHKVRQLVMSIDAGAATVLTALTGNLGDLDYLKYDVTNIAHYIRPHAKVLVVGTGGGRDILSALVFGQRSVVGVEINKNIISAVNGPFGDFTGHLDRNPAVTFVNDEARSYVARQKDTYDILQISLIDTWAATGSGAFVLTENSLYTMEACKLFLSRLSPRGVLTITRWYFRQRPGEVYRLTSLATAALHALGITDPRSRIIIVRSNEPSGWMPDGLGTLLVSKEPFSDADLGTIEDMAKRLRFDVVLSPRTAADATLAGLASGHPEALLASSPINISAPTDDSPFFFNMLRLRDAVHPELWNQGGMSFNMKAVVILGMLLLVVAGLTVACIIVPLAWTTRRGTLTGALPLFIFFGTIGLGFMLIEISQMQRLIVFLGHPTYGLSVVLCSLLLSSGLGSYAAKGVSDDGILASTRIRLALLLGTLLIFGSLTPYAAHVFEGATNAMRISVATGLLLPLGFFMGMAFPLGIRIASRRWSAVTPWLWGINGATSVCGSVLATAIALSAGISVAFWSGFLCYAVALVSVACITPHRLHAEAPLARDVPTSSQPVC